MGGDRRLLPAAARAARRGRAADAVADTGAVRPARSSRDRRSASAASCRRSAVDTHEEDAAGLRAAGHERLARRAGALLRRLRRRRTSACSERGGDLLGALARARAVDLLGHPRDPAAAGHRRGRARCRCAGRAIAPPPLRRGLARRLLAARVRARAVAGADARGGRRRRGLRGADEPLRAWSARAPAADPQRLRGSCSCPIDRQHDVARVERRTATRRRRLPRLPPSHHPPPQPVGQRRRRLRPRCRARRWRGEHAADFVRPHAARGCATTAPGCRAAGWSCARSTPSCSATGGTRASSGWAPWSRSAPGRGSSCSRLDDALERCEPAPAADTGGVAGEQLGRARGPLDLVRPRRRRARLRGAGGRAAGAARRAPGPGPRPSGSCWRCRPATGRS